MSARPGFQTAPAGRDQRRAAFVGLAVLLVAIAILASGVGAMKIGPLQVLAILLRRAGAEIPVPFDAAQEAVLLSIRLPRVLLGLLVGGGLAVAGAAMQGLFRNPLADPGLLGVSGGAALAAFATMVLGPSLSAGFPDMAKIWLLPLAAFAGALAALFSLYGLSRDPRGRVQVPVMLLAGVAVNALCGAGIGLFSWIANDAQLRGFTFWSMGGLGGGSWPALLAAAPVFLAATLLFLRTAHAMNLLALGENEAAHLGVRVERFKRTAIVLCAVMVGTAVSVAGAIGFVGLVVPHLLRMAGGPDHRWLLPASFLSGGALLIAADMLARTVVAPAELPVGILTALVGGPFFLWLVARSRRHLTWF